LNVETGLYEEAMMIDVDSDQAAELVGMIAKALYFLATGLLLPSDFAVEPRWIPIGQAEQVMRDLLRSRGHRVDIALANGLCECHGLISDETTGLSAWVFILFAGAVLGTPGSSRGDARVIAVLVGPARIFAEHKAEQEARAS
jgi:hypothetical protein